MSGWQDTPFKVEVKAGETKAFCTCGASANGPFCDGAHAGTENRPNVVKFEEDKTLFACGCLKSGNAPYCDGSHNK